MPVVRSSAKCRFTYPQVIARRKFWSRGLTCKVFKTRAKPRRDDPDMGTTVVFLWFIAAHATVCVARLDVTFFNEKALPSLTGAVYIGGYSAGAAETTVGESFSFGRIVDTGTGSALPGGSTQSNHFGYARRLNFPNGVKRTGVYYCDANADSGETETFQTVLVAEEAEIKPDSQTKTISWGDDVTLTMTPSVSEALLKWRHNGMQKPEWNGRSSITISFAKTSDAGIYECYSDETQRSDGKNGFMRLIVRGCSNGKWSLPDCLSSCPTCYNGGICDSDTGECICPPGFQGTNCQTDCGTNSWGMTCLRRCASKNPDGCRTRMFCIADPYGCSCSASYGGIDCATDCPSGMYGSGCTQTCHCINGCSGATGECNSGGCLQGWTGSKCHIPDSCDDGFYGELCNYKCHCKDNAACAKTTGVCSNGECAPGWVNIFIDDCQQDGSPKIWSLYNLKVNPGEQTSIICGASRNPVLSPDDMTLIDQSGSPVTRTGHSFTRIYLSISNYSSVTVDTGLSYTCRVDGQSQELTAFNLYVLPKFLPANKPDVTAQATQATVSWRKWQENSNYGDGPVESYKVYFKKTADTDWVAHQHFPVVDQDQTSYTTDITGLDWSTSYDFTVTVKRPGPKGEGGRETYTTETTLCDVPSDGPTITDVTSSNPNQLTVSFTVPDKSKIKCEDGYIETLYVKYRKANTQDEFVEKTIPDRSSGQFVIDTLLAYTEYALTMLFENKDAVSPPSNVYKKRTIEDVPSKPQNVTLKPAVFAIEVQWSKPNPTNGVIQKYKIVYWETDKKGTTEKDTVVTENLEDINSFLLTNLTYRVSYTVKVVAFTTPGEGDFSDEVTAETTESIPAMPTSVEVLNSRDDQIELTWTAPFPFRGDITNYGISYTSIESIFEDTQMQSQSTVVQGSIDTYTLEDLSPGTTYEIKVNASTVKGFGEPRSLMSGTTFTVDISEVLPMTDSMNNKIVHSDNQAQVILPQLADDSGISEDSTLLGYVIVLEYDQSSKRRRKRDIDPSRLGEYNETGPPYYITALLKLNNVPEKFIIGDNSENGGYRNVPLTTGRQYGVYYGLRSEVNGEPHYSLGDEPALNFRGGGPLPEEGSPVGAIVGAFMAVIIIAALAVVGVFLYRRYRPTKSKDKYREDQLHTPDENPSDDEFKYQNVLFEKSSPGSPKKTDKNEYHYANVDEINTRDKKKNGAPVTESPYATPDDVSPKAYSPLKPAKKPDLSKDGPPKLPQKPVVPPEITAKKPSVPNKPQPSPKPAELNSNSDHVIKVEDLPDYIMKKRQTDDFKKEFKTLPYGQVKSVEDAKIPDNTKKNRFRNILAYDHSRVRLDPIEGEPNSDYINASYIDGYKKEKAYIAAQGPNNLTVDDLWRLVWQQNITIILMATNLSENGKVKCHQYWPEGDNEWYGDIFVTFVGTDSYADYNVRTFQLQMEDSEVRVVKQFHFTVWPDMGVPIYATGVLGMLRHLKSSIPAKSGPLLVHCSAGVGRTGTFISIDAMQEMAKAEGKVDIYNFVRKSRENRMNFVQVEDQYEFIHTALMEATLCGNTAISSSDYRQTFTKLQKVNRQTGKAPLEEEWENLGKVSRVAREDELSVGTAKENARKNRFPSIVPFNRYRPHLMTQVEDADANDYINASFVSAYVEKDAFLVTQIPLPNTMCDFWRMVYDYNSYSIIALNDMASKDKSVGQYWPEDGALEFGPFTIETVSRDVEGSIIIRTLALSDKRGNVRTIQQFQLTGWPANTPRPKQKGVFVELMGMVEKWQQQTGNGPITVHCINGIGRSAVYCATVSACERIKVDQMVDIFQAVKTLRSNRPNMIESLDQYKFCYEIILDYFESFDTYANFQ